MGKKKNESVYHHAGDMWLFEGPGIYYPSINEEILETINGRVVQNVQALKMVAIRDCIDKKYGKQRNTGDKWLMEEPGAYLPGPYEKVEVVQEALVLSDTIAIHLKSIQEHTDIFGIERKLGEEWLITNEQCSTYQLNVHQVLVSKKSMIVLTNRDFIIIENPLDEKN